MAIRVRKRAIARQRAIKRKKEDILLNRGSSQIDKVSLPRDVTTKVKLPSFKQTSIRRRVPKRKQTSVTDKRKLKRYKRTGRIAELPKVQRQATATQTKTAGPKEPKKRNITNYYPNEIRVALHELFELINAYETTAGAVLRNTLSEYIAKYGENAVMTAILEASEGMVQNIQDVVKYLDPEDFQGQGGRAFHEFMDLIKGYLSTIPELKVMNDVAEMSEYK